ncbi:M10 family metallopeptidase C-terminal domain-containing protein [Microvirga pudoricolor]|uniref:M10 family metallopeptidase C-terminal domain-containing protein n=1 Tax=Microvirga pudoricolor TaxID=2778729 RepID=UPI00195001A4|nr:hypothetical protein [Microvirga pudoricolor]MBM6595465.1 hypothetical protein [Microvirga pudoricolor]
MRPTTSEFIYAAGWTYTQGSVAPKSPFLVDGQQMTSLDVGSGFYGAAFLTAANQVIVAFEGTNLADFTKGQANRDFAAAQILADIQIYLGQEPPAYDDAMSFTQDVIAAAAEQGISRENVFVTGHSLGGAQALYVAAQMGMGGETYGAPGIPSDAIPINAQSQLINYVEWGDPVGNYSAPTLSETNILYSQDIVRFGSATYVGPFSGVFVLDAANALLAPGNSDAQKAAGIAMLEVAANDYHRLVHYAAALRQSYDPAFSETGSLSDAEVEQLIANILENPTSYDAIRFAWHDTVTGTGSKNTLRGYAGNDQLVGGRGADKLYGGSGADTFVFKTLKDSTVAAKGRDTIYDFSTQQKDRIDLKGIDANVLKAGNQAFKYIGAADFHGKAGELRIQKVAGGSQVQGDVNGDGLADFAIAVKGLSHIAKGYFTL